jgi:TPR repeat protein
MAFSAPAPAAAGAQVLRSEMPSDGLPVHRAADYGINIVRMPPRPPGIGQSTIPATQETLTPPSKVPPSAKQPTQPQGRLVKLTARVASQPNDGLRGFLGVNMEALELPLALSLGLVNADGALILGTTAGGPAAEAGLRFGDIVVGMNGKAVANINDFRQKVMQASPGSEAILEVWRVAADDSDFLLTLRRLADGGNAHVMYRLGRLYANGNGVSRDDAQAAQWYRKGADAGNSSAMTALAVVLLEGRGTAIDQQEAVRLLKSASANNYTEAMNRLAHIFVEGKIVEKDALEGARWFTKAAEAGHTPSMVDLGRMYANGTGVQADYSKAAMWYKQAADAGHTGGMVGLGWLYELGRGVETDFVKAATLHKRAADLGNSAGMVALALLHVQGKGVEKDEAAAVALYRKAVALGNSTAMNNLAWMLQSGHGARRDPDEAADFMMKSLERRNEFSLRQMTKSPSIWTRDFRMAMQKRLQEAGLYSGRIDGNFRESTTSAVEAYFNRNP